MRKAMLMHNAMRDMMISELKEKGEFQFFQFGKFTTKVQAPRMMHHLHTGEKHLIPATVATLFKASKGLKAELNA